MVVRRTYQRDHVRMSDPWDSDAVRDLDVDARRALEVAVDEATELGQERVGTEHLLLGLIAVDGSGAAVALADAGATLAAARHKVAEAAGPRGAGAASAVSTTARAARALNRAVRFSHARRSDLVTSEHVLLGVLDVEGTAGQVLRRLGVDVPRLRAALDGQAELVVDDERSPDEAIGAEPTPIHRDAATVSCPACGADLDGGVVQHKLALRKDAPGRARTLGAYACAQCGVFLGFAPA